MLVLSAFAASAATVSRCPSRVAQLVGAWDAVVFASHNRSASEAGDGGFAFGASAGGQWSTRAPPPPRTSQEPGVWVSHRRLTA